MRYGILLPMEIDISKRQWHIKVDDQEEGPIPEDDFQVRLRAGNIPLNALIKSNFMGDWKPLLSIVASDETFRRPSTMPPSPPVIPKMEESDD